MPAKNAYVTGVYLSPHHGFSKQPESSIRLLAGLGVKGDAHCGATVQHLYLKRKSPHAPNRMQVHLIQQELFDDLLALGHMVQPGELGRTSRPAASTCSHYPRAHGCILVRRL